MQVDRYTQGVLTVIAGALCVIAAQNAASPAGAQAGPQRVAICNESGDRCAHIIDGARDNSGRQLGAVYVAPR